MESSVTYDDETQKLIETANTMRQEYQNADQRVRDIENEIRDIEKYLEKDFGPEDEYAVLEVYFSIAYLSLDYIYTYYFKKFTSIFNDSCLDSPATLV